MHIALTIFCALGCLGIPLCSTALAASSKSTTAITLIDQAGHPVTLSGPAKRVLSLSPSNTELMYYLGEEDRLVGRSKHCDYPPDALQVPSVGSLFPPDYERILNTKPDLVLMSSGTDLVRKTLQGHGLKVLVIQPKTIAAITDSLALLARALGIESAVAEKRTLFNSTLDELSAAPSTRRPRVFYEVWSRPLSSASPDSFLGNLMTVAGGRNVIPRGPNPWPKVSAEQVIASDPEIIFTAHRETHTSLMAGERPAWRHLSAVRHGQVYLIPDEDLVVRPGPRILDGLRWMSRVIENVVKKPREHEIEGSIP